ncbi:MAG TPA: hypothetical protein VIG33_07545 [Pseudobdellovibrionaceae bacterium]|jgi:hypothetical protein
MEPQQPEPQRAPKPKIKIPLPQLPAPNKTSIANQVCWYMGAFMVALSIVGAVIPGLFEAHLNPIHNFILLASGFSSLWFGLKTMDYRAKKFCNWMGGFYMMLGVAGFGFGHRALSLTRPTASGIPEESAFLWQLVPGKFELGTVDHFLHMVIGGIFLLGAYFTLKKIRPFRKNIWH